jgi:hypothetical protein
MEEAAGTVEGVGVVVAFLLILFERARDTLLAIDLLMTLLPFFQIVRNGRRRIA